jgi:hypothetical protein
MLRIICIVAMTAILAACVPDTVPVVQVPASVEKVALIAAIPHVLRLGTTGMTVFENSLDQVDITAWHLDDVAFDAAQAALSPRYQLERATTDIDPSLLHGNFFQKYAGAMIHDHVHTSSAADLYLVLSTSQLTHPDVDRPIILQDIGVSKDRTPIGLLSPVAHTYLLLTIVDGKDFHIIATTPLLMDPARPSERERLFMSAGGAAFPVQPLDGFDWKDQWKDLTPDQQNLIHTQIVTLLKESISYTIAQSKIAQ